MQQFLMEVQSKAFRMAEIATQNQDDAMDIVQDAMINLVSKYSERPYAEWKPLFYRILQSKMTDFFRKRAVTRKIFFWKQFNSDPHHSDLHQTRDSFELGEHELTPDRQLSGERDLADVVEQLKRLPYRQQQCFMLRSWEGLSVSETAKVMGCSEGSVKTHYSRARQTLAGALTTE
ncbi:MAG: RNA polymerase sigma factor [Kangiellaceae bacterium]|jgi:RNA polymerase sigma-70 factor (ECF subfamily)|nr:RNA polymerase sigma factor [Kangiellaceae bacterium]